VEQFYPQVGVQFCSGPVSKRPTQEAQRITELIAVDDVLPTVQWAKRFMAEQGYDLPTEIKEDNRSTMLLMKNGRLSSGKRTKHLEIRYFFVKDLLDRGIITLSHCLSGNMIADFFTKPIQGQRFQVLRSLMLNIDYPIGHRSVLGNSKKTDAQLNESIARDSTDTVQTEIYMETETGSV